MDTIKNTKVRLYNDVYFQEAHPYPHDSWTPFVRLPVELRLRIWQLFLQRHRMIDLVIQPTDVGHGLSATTQSRDYTDRNGLDKIISGSAYELVMLARDHAAPLSPLFYVNSEARRAALDFYHIHFHPPGQNVGQVLYLNAEYDVLYVEFDTARGKNGSILIDFVHDLRAYDLQDKGWVIWKIPSTYVCRSN